MLPWGWWHKVRQNPPVPAPFPLPSHFTPFPWFPPHNRSLFWVTETHTSFCHVIQSARGRQILGQGWESVCILFMDCAKGQLEGKYIPSCDRQSSRMTEAGALTDIPSTSTKLKHINATFWESLGFMWLPVHLVSMTFNLNNFTNRQHRLLRCLFHEANTWILP